MKTRAALVFGFVTMFYFGTRCAVGYHPKGATGGLNETHHWPGAFEIRFTAAAPLQQALLRALDAIEKGGSNSGIGRSRHGFLQCSLGVARRRSSRESAGRRRPPAGMVTTRRRASRMCDQRPGRTAPSARGWVPGPALADRLSSSSTARPRTCLQDSGSASTATVT